MSLAHVLSDKFRAMPQPRRYWVAFSGGMDSMVLLHAMHKLQAGRSLWALHVNHGLSDNAVAWQEHCRNFCRSLSIPLLVIPVHLSIEPGASIEQVARHARYRVFAKILKHNEAIVTAHHQRDQAETLLLQLFRGAGSQGLSAMAEITDLSRGWLLRPLLEVAHGDIARYAADHDLTWVEDESNSDVRFDRNFLRHTIMPLLRDRWSGIDATLFRAAQLQQENSELLNTLACRDFADCRDTLNGLAIEPLGRLSVSRRHNLIRYWLRLQQLQVPNFRRLNQGVSDLLSAGSDRQPCICWPGGEIRRYRHAIYAMRPQNITPMAQARRWNSPQAVTFPQLGVSIRPRWDRGVGMRQSVFKTHTVTISFRRGGERCRFYPGGPLKTLKQYFQEQAIPPWMRPRIPLIYANGDLVVVGNLWINPQFKAKKGEPGVGLEIHYG